MLGVLTIALEKETHLSHCFPVSFFFHCYDLWSSFLNA